MGFIRIYPLKETTQSAPEIFGKGEPARCYPDSGPGAQDYYLNTFAVAAFEEIPLYLVFENDPNNLTDGIRIRLYDNSMLVIPDDAENPENKFVSLLEKAVGGATVEMEKSAALG